MVGYQKNEQQHMKKPSKLGHRCWDPAKIPNPCVKKRMRTIVFCGLVDVWFVRSEFDSIFGSSPGRCGGSDQFTLSFLTRSAEAQVGQPDAERQSCVLATPYSSMKHLGGRGLESDI